MYKSDGNLTLLSKALELFKMFNQDYTQSGKWIRSKSSFLWWCVIINPYGIYIFFTCWWRRMFRCGLV